MGTAPVVMAALMFFLVILFGLVGYLLTLLAQKDEEAAWLELEVRHLKAELQHHGIAT